MGIQKQNKEAVCERSRRVTKYHKMSYSTLTRCINSIENCWEAASNKTIAKKSGNKSEMEEAEKKMQVADKKFNEASTMFINAVKDKETEEHQRYVVEVYQYASQQIYIIACIF